MNHATIIREFGFELAPDASPESIYPYAPVYRVRNDAGHWIVKRTAKPISRARTVVEWTRSLASKGIPVVTPAAGFGDNPRNFRSDESQQDDPWVVYPFVDGTAYRRDSSQILAAGELLGRIHADGMGVDFGLKLSETIVVTQKADIDQDTRSIREFLSRFLPESVEKGITTLTQRSSHYFERTLPAILKAPLPLTNCSWDYKASNLVYQTDTSPVLVDPDNGGRIPRAFDLAIVALIFHKDGLADSIFSRPEWLSFLEGYSRHIHLTDEERANWFDLLLSAWMDEAVWLMGDHEEGWADPIQSKFLLSLLTTDLDTLAL